MTNQQGAQEALRLADALASNYFDGKQGRDVWDAAAAELRRLHAENERLSGLCDKWNSECDEFREDNKRLAALVEAQQPAPSAAAALSDDLRDRLVAISEAIADQDDRAAQAMLREILAAPQPFPTPQADSQPALVRDYPPLPMQFACSGVFPVYSADQMHAYVDADRAARAPADSVTAPAGVGVAVRQALRHAIETMIVESQMRDDLAENRRLKRSIEVLEQLATTPPAQAADSVLEDAARWRALPAFFEEYQIDAMKLYRDIDAYLDAARKQGGA